MATLQELEQALIKADAAGNEEDARAFASEIRRLREGQPKATEEQAPPKDSRPQYMQNAPDAASQLMMQPPGDFNPLEMVKNVPGSAWQFAKDITQPIRHPISTASSLQDVGQGLVEKALPKPDLPAEYGEWGPTDNEQMVNAIGGFMKDRYGTSEARLNTLEQDPVGAASDIAGMLMAGGPSAMRVAKAIDPVNISKRAISRAVPESLPRSMYESAAKFSTTIDPARRAKMIDTAVRRGIMPTQKGVDKIADIVGRNSRKIDDLIETAESAGRRVSRKSLFRHIDELKKELTGPENLYGAQNAKKIDKAVGDYMAQLDNLGIDDLAPSQVQNLKKNIYQEINWNAMRGKGNYAKEFTGKAVAKGARESIEEIDPRIAPLNREAGELLDLRDSVTRAANRIENRDFVGIDPAMKILPAQAMMGNVGGAAGVAAAIGGYPWVKANNALMLEALRNYRTGSASVPQMMMRQGAVQSGRIDEAKKEIAGAMGAPD